MSTMVRRFEATMVALPIANIDTDQIIPARFLKVTDRTGLGDALFADWRYLPDGSPDPAFPLNHAAAGAAGILVAGDNFGCGSSREHAPWALLGFGIRAVISTSFADIFRNNALGNGLLPIEVDAAAYARLLVLCAADATAATGATDAPSATAATGAASTITAQPRAVVDLERCTLEFGDEAVTFPIEPFARYCLLHGVDRLGYLLGCGDDIAAYEQRHSRAMEVRA